MSQSLEEILHGRKYEEPTEVQLIKAFVQQRFKLLPEVAVSPTQIIIGVKSAALAGALRPLLPQIKQECGTTKQLRIRIQ